MLQRVPKRGGLHAAVPLGRTAVRQRPEDVEVPQTLVHQRAQRAFPEQRHHRVDVGGHRDGTSARPCRPAASATAGPRRAGKPTTPRPDTGTGLHHGAPPRSRPRGEDKRRLTCADNPRCCPLARGTPRVLAGEPDPGRVGRRESQPHRRRLTAPGHAGIPPPGTPLETRGSAVSTYTPKAGDTTRSWYVIDATDVVFPAGLAVAAATRCAARHKPTFTPKRRRWRFCHRHQRRQDRHQRRQVDSKMAYRHWVTPAACGPAPR